MITIFQNTVTFCKNPECSELDHTMKGSKTHCDLCGSTLITTSQKPAFKKMLAVFAPISIILLILVFGGRLSGLITADPGSGSTAETVSVDQADSEVLSASETTASNTEGKIWPDGTRWNGKIDQNGLMFGYGILEWVVNGSSYTGQTFNDMLQGYGCISYSSSEPFYIGQFHRNKKHGYGIIFYEDGTIIDGIWINDVIHYGVCIWPNGIRYTGFFDPEQPGTRQGYGVEISLPLSSQEGMWVNNEFRGAMNIISDKAYAQQMIMASYYENGLAYDETAVANWLEDAGQSWDGLDDLLAAHDQYRTEHSALSADQETFRQTILGIFKQSFNFERVSEYHIRHCIAALTVGNLSFEDFRQEVEQLGTADES